MLKMRTDERGVAGGEEERERKNAKVEAGGGQKEEKVRFIVHIHGGVLL